MSNKIEEEDKDKKMEHRCPLIDCENWRPTNSEFGGCQFPCNECRHNSTAAALGCSRGHYKQTRITPEQYEERTGNKYPDDGIVWVQHTIDTWGNLCKWKIMLYRDAVTERRLCDMDINNFIIHCILPAEPPKNKKGRFENIS
jgi:hypothetical protein